MNAGIATEPPRIGVRVRFIGGMYQGTCGVVVRHDATPFGTQAVVRLDGAGQDVRAAQCTDLQVLG